jgi:hypothetical protein
MPIGDRGALPRLRGRGEQGRNGWYRLFVVYALCRADPRIWRRYLSLPRQTPSQNDTAPHLRKLSLDDLSLFTTA